MTHEQLIDRGRGCLVGGAIGDALGGVVEFKSWSAIRSEYGPEGIRDLASRPGGATVTDDTQMTLFTAAGLLAAPPHASDSGLVECLTHSYLCWLHTQTGRGPTTGPGSELLAYPELLKRRAPGNTCLSALDQILDGATFKNTSKGCGGLMRVAPVALWTAATGRTPADAARVAALAAYVTHQHPLGYIPAAICAGALHRLLACPAQAGPDEFTLMLRQALADTRQLMHPDGSGRQIDTTARGRHLDFQAAILERAIEGAADPAQHPRDVMASLGNDGQGWVAEETLGIAVFAALRCWGDFAATVRTAVNITGDSDSTGAVAGWFAGAALGLDILPDDMVGGIELRDLIVTTADRLASARG